jgi:uncharacterized membrane protein
MQAKLTQRIQWRSVVADIVLAAIVLGPPAAPFLAASGLPLLPMIAQIIYTMGLHVCPQPEMAVVMAPPWLMAVCMRCYGTVLALLATRLLYTLDRGNGRYWLSQYGRRGLLLSVLMMLFYPAELFAQRWGLWDYSNAVVFPFGWVAGLGLGLLIMPWLHASSRQVLLHD